MDDFFSSRIRFVGVITILVIILCFAILFFVQYREKKNTSVKLKMFYSDLTQSVQFAMNTNGPPGEWGWRQGYKNIELLNYNLVNNLKISKNCIKEKGNCMPAVNYNTLKKRQTNINLQNLPSATIQNGITFAVEAVGDCHADDAICAIFYVDINGIEEPNTFGKDLFVFMLTNSTSVAFSPYNSQLPPETINEDEKYGCSDKSEVAMYCGARIYANGWSIDKKYPW